MPDVVSRLNAELEGHYAVVRQIGEGGMATVYLAKDLKHQREVAIKVLRPEKAALLGAERFLKEINLTANLQHPNILPLFDSGEAESLLYYVMPYVEGESLRHRLDREGRLDVDVAVDIVRDVAPALEYAHERGIVHRDIKPDNVLLHAGRAMVTDFGIALAFADAERERLTATGVSIGTAEYMSPEQAAGDRDVDARTDVYALGVLLYEMLTGSPPFTGPTTRTVVAKILTEEPRPIRSFRPTVRAQIEAVVTVAMAKQPEDRFASVKEFRSRLDEAAKTSWAPRLSRGQRIVLGAAAFAAILLGGVAALRWWHSAIEREAARTEVIPEIRALLGRSEVFEAFHLAMSTRKRIPDDPTLASLLDAASVTISLESHPPGAEVRYRAYDPEDTVWFSLGRTPLEDVRIPDRELVLRFELAGYRSVVRAFTPHLTRQVSVRLEGENETEDMVWIPGGTYGFGPEPVPLDSFRIDRAEVSNAEFQAFVEAVGYDTGSWATLFARLGVDFDTIRMAAELRDPTGRPGPATWTLSRHREGRGAYPVRGVSWFEAVAYCDWREKSLPTLYHWKHAAGVEVWNNMLAASNFDHSGPMPIAATGAVNRYGAVDMAGNVREWVWTGSREGRYVLGGAWDAPTYIYTVYEAADPWSRTPTTGFRCARYFTPPAPDLLEPREEPYFDFRELQPVDDETFSVYASFYSYDPVDLASERAAVDSTPDWLRERVEFSAAYPEERVPVHIFVPRNSTPPYQTVVYMPGLAAFRLTSSENVSEMSQLMFIPLSGRALVYPVYKGTYERQITRPFTPSVRRQLAIQMTQDLMRTVDYISERPDLDEERLAFMGLSFGAEFAVPVALEKRFDALVLVGAALDPAWLGTWPPEAAPWNFAYRITTPTILINGKADVMHPYAEGQIPFFEAIDVPPEDKVFIVSDAGHLPPWNEVIRHTLDWLDRRLGPVKLVREIDGP